jgi:hypothetical protein
VEEQPEPLRPTYREPHPVRTGPMLAGCAVAVAWLLLVALLAGNARWYAWLTIGASVLATVVAVLLARFGDRGVAVGVAIATGFGLAVAISVVVQRWIVSGWPLW